MLTTLRPSPTSQGTVLDPDVRVAWEARLKSGLYPQIRGKMRDLHGFCAMGVLADMAVERGLGRWEWDADNEHFWFFPARRPEVKHYTSLPSYVLDEMGVRISEACRITKANDSGFTFEQLAGLVRG